MHVCELLLWLRPSLLESGTCAWDLDMQHLSPLCELSVLLEDSFCSQAGGGGIQEDGGHISLRLRDLSPCPKL